MLIFVVYNFIDQKKENMFKKISISFCIVVVLIIYVCTINTSCISEEDYATDSGIELKCSTDTLRFDTVFTTLGSVTKTIMIYNKETKPLKIDRISLGGGSASFFRLNVDGDTSKVVSNIEIAAKDSMFIFAKVTIDPNKQSNPLLVRDSIIFSFNNHNQYIQLQAFGQDAYYHLPTDTLVASGILYSLAQEGAEKRGCIVNGKTLEWKNDKPHVIFGTLAVDDGYTLNIEEGTQIYLNHNSDFWVYSGGTLKANGSVQNPIVFQGMREDSYYATLPGQWGKLWFWAASKDNTLNNVVIKNGNIGMMVDSCVTTSSPTVDINNTRIENMYYYGLYSRGGHINAANMIVQNTGQETVALTMGGEYRFVNCTFANYWWYNSKRTAPTLTLNNYYIDVNNNTQLRNMSSCNFYNTIIYGSLSEEEIAIDKADAGVMNYHFENCLLKTKLLSANSANVSDCIFNQNPMFKNSEQGDLHLLESSPAKYNGSYTWASYYAPFDIEGIQRSSTPSMGALEYVLAPSTKFRHIAYK
jgi:hypothetical protein